MRNRYYLAFLAVSLVTAGVAAEPGKYTRWLISDPATMMDLGMHRLRKYFSGDQWDGVSTQAIYDYEADKIILSSTYFEAFLDLAETKEVCRDYLAQVRQAAGLREDGTPLIGTSSLFSKMFMHTGFSNMNMPENLPKEVDKLIRVRRVAAYKTGDPEGVPGLLTCSAELVSGGVMYSD